ncbi:integrase [Rhodoblastus acidophilus]|uniref:tyrosine-type recombinase/integrase n=1 Tax=Rhodoblastus acidophilus TaxID=1074 RepID=UPI002225A0A8|nr:site-specific integrase [Rhodoblastus acidophilus]MCW2317097.1 integrase [Rhodoblastus acidophilus]
MYGQALFAIEDLESAALAIVGKPRPDMRACDVTNQMLTVVVRQWGKEVTPATVNKRLTCLSAMGIGVKGHYVRIPKVPKWWLNPETHELLRAHLKPGDVLMLYVDWAVATGLRVEESLRLERSHFFNDFRSLTVPGTKSEAAQASIALSTQARTLALVAFAPDPEGCHPDTPMFRISYQSLYERWNAALQAVGVTQKGAVLKALRRSAARNLTVNKGMPLDVLRGYLRHRNVSTTMGYLQLTGGYSDEEQRRWLED